MSPIIIFPFTLTLQHIRYKFCKNMLFAMHRCSTRSFCRQYLPGGKIPDVSPPLTKMHGLKTDKVYYTSSCKTFGTSLGSE